ncbi:flippase-like domain-containing protein [candidate division KSB1 bacterium]|nr:flippase-like domain-containing protein [candidate division KSB1 bacterium]
MPFTLSDKRKLFDPAIQKRLLFGLKILVTILAISLLVRKISCQQLLTAFTQAETKFIAAAAALLAVNIFFQYRKWQLIVHRDYPSVKNRQILYSLFIGLALGLVTPGRLGDFARTFFIKDVQHAGMLALLLIDKLITLAVLYFIGILGLSHFISMGMHPYIWTSVFILTLALLLFLVLLSRPAWVRRILARYHRLFSRHPAIDRFIDGIESAKPALILQLLAWTILQTVTYCSQFVLLVRAFNDISLINGYLATFAVMFTKSLLPISLGDLGVRESAAIFFLAQLHVPEAAAFNASFLLFTVNILMPSILGLGLFLFKRQNSAKSNGKTRSA